MSALDLGFKNCTLFVFDNQPNRRSDFVLPVVWEVFGWIGTALAIAMFAPQVIKVLRTKDVSSLSKSSFGVYAFGCSMWVIFCGITHVWQGFASNGVNLILMCVIFWYLLKNQKWYFAGLIAFTIVTFVVSVILAFVIKDYTIAVNYVFVILAGCALGVSFIPQVRNIFILKDFKSYSFFTSMMLNLCNVFWVLYWAGTIVYTATTGPEGTLPVFIIALITTASQIVVQVTATPFYFINKRKQNMSRKNEVKPNETISK